MERIALAITTPSLHRRVSEALTEAGRDVVSWDTSGPAPVPPAGVLVVESVALAADPARALSSRMPVIVLVRGCDDPFWDTACGRRPAGIVDRDDPDQGFVTAVAQVLTGRGWISPELVPRVLAQLPVPTGSGVPATGAERLTERESDIARLVAEGLSNAEIAQRLTIERSTVKFHVSNALRKLRCRDRAQLVVALHRGALARSGTGHAA
ncbi:response regulator transcription factor [Streptomyces sp. NPDC047017]|uniref:helix-turn-helix transcriptional regulator n=1 Tax=Streptomyces sp. NPDC047017 TaxID=3155024 RepID=UPI0033FB2E94